MKRKIVLVMLTVLSATLSLGVVTGPVSAAPSPQQAQVAKVGTDSPICDDGTSRCFTVPQMVHNIKVNSPRPWRDLHLGTVGFRLPPAIVKQIARTHARWCPKHPAHCTVPKYQESWKQQVIDCGLFGCWWPDFRQITQCAQGSMVNLGCTITKTAFSTMARAIRSEPVKVTILCGGMFIATTTGQEEITGGMVLGAGGACGVDWFASKVWPW